MLDLEVILQLIVATASGGGLVKVLDAWATAKSREASTKAVEAEATERLVQAGIDLSGRWQERATVLEATVNNLKADLERMRAELREATERHQAVMEENLELKRRILELEQKVNGMQDEQP